MNYDTFIQAVLDNNLIEVKTLLKDKAINPAQNNNTAIGSASAKGFYDMVRLLLNDPRVDPSDNNSHSLLWSVQNKYVDVALLLLEDGRVDATIYKNSCISKSFYALNDESMKSKMNELIYALWNYKNVKENLMNDNSLVYNNLVTNIIKNKLNQF
jgi:hypothetical protein